MIDKTGDKTGDEKFLWDAINMARSGPLGRLNHTEIELMLASLAEEGVTLVRAPLPIKGR